MQGKRRGISAIFILQQMQNAPVTKNGGCSTNTLRNICNTVADQAYENKYYDFSNMLNGNINEAYKLINGKNIDGKVKIMKDAQEEAYKKYEKVPKG